MKFSISQSELQNALSIVSKGVSTRSTLPVLSGIHIATDDDKLIFQTTDLELSIQYAAQAMIDEHGAAVLPGKLLLDIVKNLPDAAVHVTADETGAIITCDNSSFSIKAMNAEDFPGFPSVEPEQKISIPFDTFSQMAKRVRKVTSKDESRAILTGVLLTQQGDTLRMVATDSYRLAVAEEKVQTDAEDFSVVIAGAFLSDLAALPRKGADIVIAVAENQLLVSYDETVFVNRRLEGKFPNYQQLLPPTCETTAQVSTHALVSAVRRAGLLGQGGSSVRFNIDADSQTITLSSTVQDIGSTQETLNSHIDGTSMEIAFNGDYVVEGLTSVSASDVVLELQSPMRPGIFKGAGSTDYLYLVMPVRIA